MADLIFLAFMVVALCTGTIIEKRHFASIRKREREMLHLPIHTMKRIPDSNVKRVALVTSSVAIAVDAFKVFLGGLRVFFGGRSGTFEALADRARREALLRLKEQHRSADYIANTRLEMLVLDKKKVVITAYGTAVYLDRPHAVQTG